MPMPLFSGAGCRRGSSFIAQASLECARESLRLPIDYSKVVPLLESECMRASLAWITLRLCLCWSVSGRAQAPLVAPVKANLCAFAGV
eukprot:1160456-Pelagomonas_calceolata.AAC.9